MAWILKKLMNRTIPQKHLDHPENWWGFQKIPIVSNMILIARFIIILISFLFFFIAKLFILLFGRRVEGLFIQWYTKQLCRILGIKIHLYGTPIRKRKGFVFSNHLSYLDPMVLYRVFEGNMAARLLNPKNWLLVLLMWISGRAIFIKGNHRSTVKDLAKVYRKRKEKEPLTVFPEAGIGYGRFLKPFKSSFFALTEKENSHLPVQPVTIRYHLLHNLPMGRFFEQFYIWPGDETFLPHFWKLMEYGGVTVEVTCHDPVTLDDFGGDRKKLCKHCERVIKSDIESVFSARKSPKGVKRRL